MRGRLTAQVDMQRGRYQVLGYGMPSPSRPEYARCLRERYTIDFRPVAGCIVSESLVPRVCGKSRDEIERTSGRLSEK